jgi:DNA-binding IclR family transcriptional regulator
MTSSPRHSAQPLAATHERVLRVLGLSRRPLQSGELQNALGLVPNETVRACAWLTDRGYISTVQRGRVAQQAKKQWTLAHKGRSWAKDQGALGPDGV